MLKMNDENLVEKLRRISQEKEEAHRNLVHAKKGKCNDRKHLL
jgi:hypothetical protein